MVRLSPTHMATVLVFLKVFSRLRATMESVAPVSNTARKKLIPDFHEDPENQVLLFRAAPLLPIKEFHVQPRSHERFGHPGQSPLLAVRLFWGGVISLQTLLRVSSGGRRRSSGR